MTASIAREGEVPGRGGTDRQREAPGRSRAQAMVDEVEAAVLRLSRCRRPDSLRKYVSSRGSPPAVPYSLPSHRYTVPARIPPTIGATQNNHSCESAHPPTNSAGPVLLAGFTDRFVTGMPTR